MQTNDSPPSEVKIINTFEIEASPSTAPERIYNYLISKSIPVTEFVLKEKSDDTITYSGKYESTLEAICTLEKIKLNFVKDSRIPFKLTKLSFSRQYLDEVNEYKKEEQQRRTHYYPIDYDNVIRTCYIKTYGTQGLEFINQDILSRHKNVITYMIKKIGTNLLSGKSVMNISFPISIFDYKSILENHALNHCVGEEYLTRAAGEGNLERLKLIMASEVAVLHLHAAGLKPFNPILGETFQAKIGNSLVYIEQTSHHPPIFNYYTKNPLFEAYGFNATEAYTSANSLTAEVKGKYWIKFKDGSLYKVSPGKLYMYGIVVGSHFLNYQGVTIEDITNDIVAQVRINPDDRSYLSKLFTSQKTFPDYLIGFIANKKDTTYDTNTGMYKLNEKSLSLCTFDGEWSGYFNADGVNYWRHGEKELLPMDKMEFMLPSDSSFREDILLLKKGKEEYAQEAKTYLEEIQRFDKKNREMRTVDMANSK